jgi:hypothetical protein
VEELLKLPFLQPQQVTDSLHAYQLSKRGDSLRVMAEAVRWANVACGSIRSARASSSPARQGRTHRAARRRVPAYDRGVCGWTPGTPDEVGTVGECVARITNCWMLTIIANVLLSVKCQREIPDAMGRGLRRGPGAPGLARPRQPVATSGLTVCIREPSQWRLCCPTGEAAARQVGHEECPVPV